MDKPQDKEIIFVVKIIEGVSQGYRVSTQTDDILWWKDEAIAIAYSKTTYRQSEVRQMTGAMWNYHNQD
jgi:hypothetical protein